VRWLKERGKYEALGRIVADRMKSGIRAIGLWCEASSRAKEPHSLIKKLLRKPEHSYDSLSDKVGARCVIRYRGDMDRVVEVAKRLFVSGQVDSKAASLGTDHIGYLSIHVDVSLRADDVEAHTYEGMHVELQIRTLAQHLWSEMSHDSVYKSDEVFARLPDPVRRRVNLMAGIIEVADMEFDRLNDEIKLPPEVLIYKALETHFYQLTAQAPDPALSVDIISLLLPIYHDASLTDITARLDAYVTKHGAALEEIYAIHHDAAASALLFQPEALMIAELLDHDEPTALRSLWSTRFPESELERLAVVLGHSFD